MDYLYFDTHCIKNSLFLKKKVHVLLLQGHFLLRKKGTFHLEKGTFWVLEMGGGGGQVPLSTSCYI